MPRILLILLAALSWWAAAEAAELEGLPVVEVRFEPAQQPLDAKALDRLTAIHTGQPLRSADVASSITELFDTGSYANISVEAEERDGGVAVTFLTEPNWFVGAVEALGVEAPPTPAQLATATRLRLGQLVTPEAVSEAQRQLRRLLADNGFQSPGIEVRRRERPETREVDLIFQIQTGDRARFGDILMTGDSQLTEKRLRDIAGWKPGRDATDPRLEQGVAQLREDFHKRGYWQADVEIMGRDFNPDKDRVDLVVRIRRGPQVIVRVEGFDLSDKKMRRYVPIFEEGLVDVDLLAEGAANLKNFLQSKGYFDVSVEFERVRSTDEVVEIVYRIEPGRRRKLSHLEIRGARYFPPDTIRERLLLEESSLQRRRGRFSQSLLDRDVESIERLYRTNGFRDVKVTTEIDNNYQGKEGRLAVAFDIVEGPSTVVDHLEVKGMERFPLSPSDYRFASAEGQPFSETSVATDRDLILAEYYDAGFQDASFDWSVRPTDDPGRVVVSYEVREGEQLEVRDTVVSGFDHTRLPVIERQLLLQPGAPLSQTAMFESQRRLYDLGIFSKVDVALQNPEGDESAKNVLFQLEESRRWAIGFGGGAEFARLGGGRSIAVSQPIGQAAFSPRVTVELTRLNLRGKGNTFGLRTRISNLQQRALLTYENPRFTGSDNWKMIVSGLYDTSRNVRTFTGARAEGAFQLEHRFSKFRTGLYRYTYRRTTINQDTLQITPLLVPLSSQPVRAALFSGTYIEDRRDDPIDATRGSFNTVDLGFASGYWGSQPDFFRFLGQNSTYYHLSRKLTLARTTQVGLLTPWGDKGLLDDPSAGLFYGSSPDPRLPLSERFFSGGANSHRGFPFNQAGPRDPTTGFPIGGGAQFLNSIELRFPLFGESIGGVLFHDAGNVYSKPGAISFRSTQRRRPTEDGSELFDYDYMVHAVGFGLRYRTPVGPVRIDLAYGINTPRFVGYAGSYQDLINGTGSVRTQKVSSFQFHFSLGQTF
ncbi:MAG: BamA/TamA family outer membrane protein [Acidobacteria bacterium]|nr:BamA/TamA family outer membrane protein [Acidobacteriota bacterium]